MHVDERVVLPLALTDAWNFVWQIDRLAGCVPGCVGVQPIEPGRSYKAQVVDHIGPYRVEIDLDVVVQDSQPCQSIHVVACGRDRRLGSAQRVELDVRLHPLAERETSLALSAEVEVLGKIASLGQFAIKRKVRDVVKRFGENVRAVCAPQGDVVGHA